MSVEYCPKCGSNDLKPGLSNDAFECPGCRIAWIIWPIQEEIGTRTPARLYEEYVVAKVREMEAHINFLSVTGGNP